MYAKSASLKNFRNIKEAEISFSPGVNILVGENAQGKTNLLEAIFYASVGRSFRAVNSAELIAFGEKSAQVTVKYKMDEKERDDSITVKLFSDKKKTVEKNNLRVDRMSDIIGSFRAVLFCPEHLSLVKDGPAERRGYLDIAISRISPRYIRLLQNYNYLMKQRNALLKSAYENRPIFDATIELWSYKLAETAADVSEQRLNFIKRVSSIVQKHFNEMTEQREHTELIYRGNAGLEEYMYADKKAVYDRYMELLMNNHEREIAMGATLYGIHKDDIDIRLNGRSARIYASQGQQRSLALAMKLAEGEICKEEFGDYPVFLLDDVLSELDETRREYMILNATDKQVIISTCEGDFVKKISCDKLITVENGTYKEV